MKTRNFEKDYIKAVRRISRLEEIEKYGKQLSMRPTKVHKVKTTYKRKGKHKENFCKKIEKIFGY